MIMAGSCSSMMNNWWWGSLVRVSGSATLQRIHSGSTCPQWLHHHHHSFSQPTQQCNKWCIDMEEVGGWWWGYVDVCVCESRRMEATFIRRLWHGWAQYGVSLVSASPMNHESGGMRQTKDGNFPCHPGRCPLKFHTHTHTRYLVWGIELVGWTNSISPTTLSLPFELKCKAFALLLLSSPSSYLLPLPPAQFISLAYTSDGSILSSSLRLTR